MRMGGIIRMPRRLSAPAAVPPKIRGRDKMDLLRGKAAEAGRLTPSHNTGTAGENTRHGEMIPK